MKSTDGIQHSFLIGTHRSGTTWLGGLLGTIPGVAYWSEPRQVWSYGNWSQPDDRLEAADCTPKIANHIRRRFARYTRSRNASYFLEKTPSNCLRVDFIRSVFPDAKFIFLLRDGRAVIRSTEEMRQAGPDWSRIAARIRTSSWRELPSFIDRLPWIYRKLIGKKLEYWGTRPPGWQSWIEEKRSDRLTELQVLALQWSATVSSAADDILGIPEENKICLKYEDLVSKPKEELARILKTIGVNSNNNILQNAQRSCHSAGVDRWRTSYKHDEIDELESIMRPTLERFGYEW